MPYEDEPYDVFLGKKAVVKVVSDANMSPENNITGKINKTDSGQQRYTGVRIRSNITKKEYNIPHKKELDIRKNKDGSIELSGKSLQEVDRKDLRGVVKKYAEKNYLSQFDNKGNLIEVKPITIESDGEQVIMTKKGINDVAEKIKGGKKSIDYSESVFRTNNQPYKVNLRIKDIPDLSRYHYHTLEKMGEIEIQKIEPLDGTYTMKGDKDLLQVGSITNNSVSDSTQKINTATENGTSTTVDSEIDQIYNNTKRGEKNGSKGTETTNEADFRERANAGRDVQGRQGGVEDNSTFKAEWADRTGNLRSHESVLVEPKLREHMNKSGIADLKLKDSSGDNAAFSAARVPFNAEHADSPVLLKDKPDVYVLMKTKK